MAISNEGAFSSITQQNTPRIAAEAKTPEAVAERKAVRVAIIDDDVEIRSLLKNLFLMEGYETVEFSSAVEALPHIPNAKAKKADAWDLIVCDLMLPEIDGIGLIERLNEMAIDIPVILITANATIETAAEALKRGAFDYIAKPINFTELNVITSRAIKLRNMERAYARLQEKLTQTASCGEMVGKSDKMKGVFSLVDRVAKSDSNVLVLGESGTGKEMVARAIHTKSDRKGQPFVAVNCSAIPETLLESELFGHKKGSFTGANEDRKGLFEEAQGGTLFLDEIGDMPYMLQAKLLRVIQERKVKPVGDNKLRDIDVRIVAATHKDLAKAVQDGTFREDLYYRLCVFPITLPPLRERREDIAILSEHFLKKACKTNKIPEKCLSKSAISKLMRLRLGGNVRELENIIERAVLLTDQTVVDDCHIRIEGSSETEKRIDTLFSKLPTLDQLEREYIRYVLAETDGKKEAASEILGINRKTLYRKERSEHPSSQEELDTLEGDEAN